MKTRQDGFSLIELMIAMVISLVAMGAIYQVFQSVNLSYRMRTLAQETEQELRIAMDILVRDLRMAGYDPHDTKSFGIIAATTNRIEFTTDLDEDRDVMLPYVSGTNWRGERIGYQRNGRDLEMVIVENDTGDEENYILISNITNMIFTYRDLDGAVTNEPSRIAMADILISIARDDESLQSHNIVRTLSSRVRFRNLNLN